MLAGPDPERLVTLASVPRKGFDTAIIMKTTKPYVEVRAKNASGRILGAAEAIESA